MKRRALIIAAGALLVLMLTWAWHGPVGTAERLTREIEETSAFVLEDWEMGHVSARAERAPLQRRLLLTGDVDRFQRTELVRLMGLIPGVGDVDWTDTPEDRRGFMVPLLVEVTIYAWIAFALGLLFAYLLELRRRYRAKWRW